MRKLSLMMALLAALGLFAACSEGYDYTAQEVYDAVKEAYGEDFIPDGEMDDEDFVEDYGLDLDDIEDKKGAFTRTSLYPDRFVVIKAKSGRGDEVEKALRAVCDGLVENSIWTVTYLPKLSAAQVVRKDDYVAFIMLGAVDGNLTTCAGEEQDLFAKEQVQIGVDAFYDLFEKE